ncbi:Arc family DNA-binding protein [Rheinheimera muenzenbergensis]|uniref:Arc family DNA-binding protein n=1 Tax=Rheinheimera muenzenbergensis TaxID=1193628 RepID=A0ABU8C307_9GAMM
MAKKAFALRLDEAMLSALQRWADDEFRSINGQIEYLLHQALQKNGRLPAKAAKAVSAVEDVKDQDS